MDLFSHGYFKRCVQLAGLWVALLTVGLIVFRLGTPHLFQEIAWMWLFAFTTCLGLFSLGKVLAGVLSQKEGARPDNGFRLLFWGSIKLGCWIFLGGALFRAKEIPLTSLLLGMATMVVLPVCLAFFEHKGKWKEVPDHA